MAIDFSHRKEAAVYNSVHFDHHKNQPFGTAEQQVTYTLPDLELSKSPQIQKTIAQERHHRQVYTGEAIEYDRHRFADPWGKFFNAFEQQQIFKLLGLKPGQTVLDAPVGTGRIGAYLAQQGLKVTGLDLTRNMLAQAQRRGEQAGLNMSFIEANARHAALCRQSVRRADIESLLPSNPGCDISTVHFGDVACA